MPRVTTCRFCRQTSVDGDHPKCAQDFGEPIKAKIFKHLLDFPHHPLSQEIATGMFSPEWGWYKEYVAKMQKEEDLVNHIVTMRNNIRLEADQILSEPANRKRLEAFLKPFNGETFFIDIQSALNVVPERRIKRKR